MSGWLIMQEDRCVSKNETVLPDGKPVLFCNKLRFSILGVILKFEQNLQKGLNCKTWFYSSIRGNREVSRKGLKTTGARLLHHPSWAGWNFAKFDKVKKTTMSPLSYTSRCTQDDCDCQPPFSRGWEGVDIISQAVLHHWTWGVTPCKATNCKKIQYVQNLHILLLTANMFHFGTSCNPSFKELLSNLSERLQGCWSWA